MLARRAVVLPDVGMRVRYLRSVMEALPAVEVADVLLLAWTGAEARKAGHGELLLALVVGLHRDAEALRERVARAAVERGHDDVAAILRPAIDPDGPNDLTHGIVPERSGRPLTLGERKSLARRVDRKTLDRALRDPHPDVMQILLRNPMVTEPDVVRLSARRDVPQTVLREVFLNERWVVRPPVQRALVKNPRTPFPLALSLAPHLDAREAQEVATSPSIDARIRRACDRGADTVH